MLPGIDQSLPRRGDEGEQFAGGRLVADQTILHPAQVVDRAEVREACGVGEPPLAVTVSELEQEIRSANASQVTLLFR